MTRLKSGVTVVTGAAGGSGDLGSRARAVACDISKAAEVQIAFDDFGPGMGIPRLDDQLLGVTEMPEIHAGIVATAAHGLASDASHFITEVELPLDGRRTV